MAPTVCCPKRKEIYICCSRFSVWSRADMWQRNLHCSTTKARRWSTVIHGHPHATNEVRGPLTSCRLCQVHELEHTRLRCRQRVPRFLSLHDCTWTERKSLPAGERCNNIWLWMPLEPMVVLYERSNEARRMSLLNGASYRSV